VDALSLLHDDHVAVLAMLEELERGPSGQTVTPDDLAARRLLMTELIKAESAHEALEEQFFWPSVRHWLAEGNELAAPAVRQEQSAKRLLAELEKLEAGDPTFERLVQRVIADAREHIRYEETQVWPVVRDKLARSELDELARKMTAARKVAPTRPHPRTPPKPGVLKTVGVAAAAMDRVRDVATHRGTGGGGDLSTSGPAAPSHAGTAAPGGEGSGAGDERSSAPWRLLVGLLTLVLIVVAARRRGARGSKRGA
jgi:hemerythrin-like domain-containing protein